MTFKDFGFNDSLIEGLDAMGFESPTPVQSEAIPIILKQKDLIACAQTGTGKTAAFILPIINKLSHRKGTHINTLVIAPTRELAIQIDQQIEGFAYFTGVNSCPVYGGSDSKVWTRQEHALKHGTDIVIATPGRLLSHLTIGNIDFSKVEHLILDEADRMLDMGFLRDIERVMKLMPSKRQNLMFSATFSKDIRKLAHSILNRPVEVEATPENSTVDAISQKVYRVAKGLKTNLIIKLISDDNWKQVLVFTRTKHGANKLCKKMISANITAAAIHGNKSQGARTKALAGFKSGSIRVLVATDIAARGLDIPLLPHVVNFELPNISEDYVHRIGRTGRAGAKGEALSLVSADETTYLKSIEKLIDMKLPVEVVEGFEPDPNASTEPIKQGQGRSRNSNRNSNSNKSRNASNRNSNRNSNRKPNNRRN